MSRRIQFEQWVPFAVEKVFLFFADPQNLPRIMPPATGTKLIETRLVPPPGGRTNLPGTLAGVGSEIVTSFQFAPFLPLQVKWTARITEFEWNHHFADLQIRGPFKRFFHRHELVAETRNGVMGTVVRDNIEFDIGYSLLGNLAEKFIMGQLRATFAYRQSAVEKLLKVE